MDAGDLQSSQLILKTAADNASLELLLQVELMIGGASWKPTFRFVLAPLPIEKTDMLLSHVRDLQCTMDGMVDQLREYKDKIAQLGAIVVGLEDEDFEYLEGDSEDDEFGSDDEHMFRWEGKFSSDEDDGDGSDEDGDDSEDESDSSEEEGDAAEEDQTEAMEEM